MPRRVRTSFAAQRGLSLIELMVAIVVGLLVVLSGLVVLANAQVTSTGVIDNSRLQLKADAIFRNLGFHLSQAGAVELRNTGGDGRVVFSSEFTGYNPAVTGAAPGQFLAVHGTEGAANAPDLLRISYEDNGAVRDCLGNRTANAVGSGVSRVDNQFSVTGKDLMCQGSTAATAQSIGDGVEDFQVTYAIRSQVAGVVSFRTYTAATVPLGSWPAVSAVTICLQLVGDLQNFPTGSTVQGCRGQSVAADGRLRRVYSRTFALRNAVP